MAGAVTVVLAASMLVLVLWPGTAWWVEHVDGVRLHGKGGLVGKERQEVLDNARGRITAVVTGVLVAFAIYYTANNARSARQTAQAAQENVNAALRASEIAEAAQLRTFELTQEGLRQTAQDQRRTHELTERGQLTDRFTAAVAQLGDTNPAIQLGGVHALAGIADDAPRTLRQTCIDVLCAYPRLPYSPDPGPLDEGPHNALTADERDAHHERRTGYRGLREVRHTILRLIGNHLRLDADDPRSWQGHDFDFTDAVFDGGDLHGAHFSTATFTRTTFTHDFTFLSARFSGGAVDFTRAEFSGGTVDFGYAEFSGGAVHFGVAAKFSGSTVDFTCAKFSGGMVSFVNAKFSDDGMIDFGGAKFSGGTIDLRGGRASAIPSLWQLVGADGSPAAGVLLPNEW